MRGFVSWQELGIANQDERKEPRFAMAVPIEVVGFDFTGRFFVEITKTIDISQSGCGFSLNRRVERGAIINIKLLNNPDKDSTRSFLYQVARANFADGRWRTGAAKLQISSLWSAVSRNATEASAQS